MNILGKTPQEFVDNLGEKLPFFLKKTTKGKEAMIVGWLKGYESERYAAEPVYGVTGVGHLKSKGVEGLVLDRKTHSEITREKVSKFRDEASLLILQAMNP